MKEDKCEDEESSVGERRTSRRHLAVFLACVSWSLYLSCQQRRVLVLADWFTLWVGSTVVGVWRSPWRRLRTFLRLYCTSNSAYRSEQKNSVDFKWCSAKFGSFRCKKDRFSKLAWEKVNCGKILSRFIWWDAPIRRQADFWKRKLLVFGHFAKRFWLRFLFLQFFLE